MEIASGLFALGGALVAGLFTYLAARVGHRWDRARSDIQKLSEQVAAYHKLEELYKVELAVNDPAHRAAKTIQQDMRDKVQGEDGHVRPEMTAHEAQKIGRSWR